MQLDRNNVAWTIPTFPRLSYLPIIMAKVHTKKRKTPHNVFSTEDDKETQDNPEGSKKML